MHVSVDIPDLVVPIKMSYSVATNNDTTEVRVPIGQAEVITSKIVRSPS